MVRYDGEIENGDFDKGKDANVGLFWYVLERFQNTRPLIYISLNALKNEAYRNKQKEPFKFNEMQISGPVF